MPSHRRLLNALAAICTLMLVAAVLAVFADPSPTPDRAVRTFGASPSSSSAPLPSASVSSTATAAAAVVPTTSRPQPTATVTTVAPSPTTAALPQHWAVGTISLSLVDTSRATPSAPGVPGEASRALPTIVRYPAEGGDQTVDHPGVPGSHLGAPFPLIVFAHGYDTSPAAYAALQRAWASAGYVVAAPSFPRATAGGPLNEGDVNNQPGDLSFVITKVLALAAPGGALAGLVDTAHVGVAGHSDGASTTAGVGYNSCCHDGRVLADAVMEGDEHPFPGGTWFPAGAAAPLLVIQADHDALNPPALGRKVYNDAKGPRYLLDLINAQHLEPFTSDAPHLAVVEAVTVSFFDRYLKGRVAAVAAMAAAAPPGLATLTSG